MKFCYNCGSPIEEEGAFCVECGAKLSLADVEEADEGDSAPLPEPEEKEEAVRPEAESLVSGPSDEEGSFYRENAGEVFSEQYDPVKEPEPPDRYVQPAESETGKAAKEEKKASSGTGIRAGIIIGIVATLLLIAGVVIGILAGRKIGDMSEKADNTSESGTTEVKDNSVSDTTVNKADKQRTEALTEQKSNRDKKTEKKTEEKTEVKDDSIPVEDLPKYFRGDLTLNQISCVLDSLGNVYGCFYFGVPGLIKEKSTPTEDQVLEYMLARMNHSVIPDFDYEKKQEKGWEVHVFRYSDIEKLFLTVTDEEHFDKLADRNKNGTSIWNNKKKDSFTFVAFTYDQAESYLDYTINRVRMDNGKLLVEAGGTVFVAVQKEDGYYYFDYFSSVFPK